MAFGTWISKRRQEAGLTLRDLAKKSGLSLPYVAGLEKGTSEAPPLKTCKTLARALDIAWLDVWEQSFSARLRRWLKREGFERIPDEEFMEILARINRSNRRPTK